MTAIDVRFSDNPKMDAKFCSSGIACDILESARRRSAVPALKHKVLLKLSQRPFGSPGLLRPKTKYARSCTTCSFYVLYEQLVIVLNWLFFI